MKAALNNLKIISCQAKGLKDCGARCLQIIANFYGKDYRLQYLRNIAETKAEGASLYGLSKAATEIGFFNIAVKVNFAKLEEANPVPFIAYLDNKHFVVVNKIYHEHIFISDPALGEIVYSRHDFLQKWIVQSSNDKSEEGIALLLESFS